MTGPAGRGRGREATHGGGSRVVSVLLVEEFTLVREGVRALIEREPDMHVCGEAASLDEATHGVWEPAVIAHGLHLRDAWGPEIVTKLRDRYPRTPLLVLTRFDSPTYVHLALRAGARGYLLKDSASSELVEAIRLLARDQSYVQPSLGAVLVRWDAMPRRQGPDSFFALTRREQEVLELIALGHTNVEVAAALGVALRTVESHRSRISRKLGLSTRAEFVQFVAEQAAAGKGGPGSSLPEG